jgi:hypothetical protein
MDLESGLKRGELKKENDEPCCTERRAHNCYFCTCLLICLICFVCLIIFITMFETEQNFETTSTNQNTITLATTQRECRFIGLSRTASAASFALNYTDSDGQFAQTVFTVCPFEAASPPAEWYSIRYVERAESCPIRSKSDYVTKSFQNKLSGFVEGETANCYVNPTRSSNYRFCPTDSSSCISNGYEYQMGLMAYTLIVAVGLALSLLALCCMCCLFDNICCM